MKTNKKINKTITLLSTAWTTVEGWKNRIIERLYPANILLVNMEHVNGIHTTFLTKPTKDGTFRYQKKRYVIDPALKYYHQTTKHWSLDYHEAFALPIQRMIAIDNLKSAFSQSSTDVEYACNPNTLDEFIISKISEGVMRGQRIDEFFKQIRMMIVITMIASVIMLVLFVFKTGMLSTVRLPGF